MRCACLLLAAALLVLPRPARAQRAVEAVPADTLASPFAQALSERDLAREAVGRLSETLRLLDGWAGVVVNDYAAQPAAPGGSARLAPPVTVLVDGQPVPHAVLGRAHLDALPVHPGGTLARMAATPTPVLRDGRWHPAGVLELRTRRPPRGWSAGVAGALGNETGDPGPFAYVDTTLINVDTKGPSVDAAAARAGRRGFVRAGVKYDREYATDAQIRPRVGRRFPNAPRSLLLAPHLTAHVATEGAGTHTLQLHGSRLHDLRFEPVVGFEVPATQQRLHAAVRGAARPGGLGWRYDASLTRTRLAERPGARADLDYGWTQDEARATLAYTTLLGFHRVTVGAGADGLRAEADTTQAGAGLADDAIGTGRVFAGVAVPLRARGRQALDAALALTDGALGWAVTAQTDVRLAPRHRLALTLAAARQPHAAAPSAWYWLAQGAVLPGRDGHALALPDAFRTRTDLSATLGWTGRLHRTLTATLVGAVRRRDGFAVPLYDAAFDAQRRPDRTGVRFVTATHVVPDATGTTGRLRAALDVAPHAALRHHLYAVARDVLAGDEALTTAWRTLPRVEVGTWAEARLPARLTLGARLAVTTERRWPGYAPADAATGGRFPTTLPPLARLDVSAAKRFWGERLRASAALRNLLDARLRSHPAGSIQRFALFVRLEARL